MEARVSQMFMSLFKHLFNQIIIFKEKYTIIKKKRKKNNNMYKRLNNNLQLNKFIMNMLLMKAIRHQLLNIIIIMKNKMKLNKMIKIMNQNNK
jgi:hypothetical protein